MYQNIDFLTVFSFSWNRCSHRTCFIKKTPTQVFSREYCKISETIYFEERLKMAEMAASPERFSTTANSMFWTIWFLWLVCFLKVNEPRYIVSFEVSGSIKMLFSIDCVNIYFSQSIVNYFFSIDLKLWGYPTLLISWFINFKVVWCQKTDRNWDQKQILDYLI